MASQPHSNVNVDKAKHLSVSASAINDTSAHHHLASSHQPAISRPVTPLSRTFPLSNVAEKETFGTAVLSAGSDAIQMARAARARSRSEAKQMPHNAELSRLAASPMPPVKDKGKARARSPDVAQPSSDDTLLGSWDAVGHADATFDSPSAARRSRMNSVTAAAGIAAASPIVLTDLSQLLEDISVSTAGQGEAASPLGTQRHRSESHGLPKYATGVPLFPHNAFSPQPELDGSLSRPRASTYSVPLMTGTPTSKSRARAGSILHRAPSPLGTPGSVSSRGGGLKYKSSTPSMASMHSSQVSPVGRSPAPPLAANEPFPSTLASPRPPQVSHFADSYDMHGPFQSSPVQARLYAPTSLRSRGSIDTSFDSNTSGSGGQSPELSMTASTRADSSLVDTPDTSAGSIPGDANKSRDFIPSNNSNESVESQDLSVSFGSSVDDSPSDDSAQRPTLLSAPLEEGEWRRKSAPAVGRSDSGSRSRSNSPVPDPAAVTRPKSHTIAGDERGRILFNAPVLDAFGAATMGPWTPNTSPQLGAAASAAYSSSSILHEQQGDSSEPLLVNVVGGVTFFGDSPRPRANTIATQSPTSQRSSTVADISSGNVAAASELPSVAAFDELVESTLNHPNTSGGEAKAIASALGAGEYRCSSPTLADPLEVEQRSACELCACLCIALTTLEPCGHRACPTCTSSGINQVSTSPPRKHTCAACHLPVKSISLGTRARSASSEEEENFGAGKGGPGSDESLDQVIFKTMATACDGAENRSSSPAATDASRPSTARPSAVYQKSGTLSGGARSFFASTHKGTDGKAGTHQGSLNATAKSCEQGQRGKDKAPHLTDTRQGTASVYQARDTAVAAVQSQHASSRKADAKAPPMSATAASFAQQPFALSPSEFDDDTEDDRDLHTDAGTVVVRIDNIPWTVSYKDIAEWLSEENVLPSAEQIPHAVHVPIELPSGKTANSCFIECADKAAAMKVIRKLNNARLCGRPVSLILSSHRELLDEVFPSRAHRLFGGGTVWFNAWELAVILHLLQEGSTQLKGPVKVVEHFTSMLRLLPAEGVAQDLRDHFFERTCDFVAVCVSIVTSARGLRASLDRLLHQVAQCSALTVSQKIRVFETAKQSLQVHAKTQVVPAPIGPGQQQQQQQRASSYLPPLPSPRPYYPSSHGARAQPPQAWSMPTSLPVPVPLPWYQPSSLQHPPPPPPAPQYMSYTAPPQQRPAVPQFQQQHIPFPIPYAPHPAYPHFAAGVSMPVPSPPMPSPTPDGSQQYAATVSADARLAMMTDQATAAAVERAQRLSPYPPPPPHMAAYPQALAPSQEYDAMVRRCMAELFARGQPPLPPPS